MKEAIIDTDLHVQIHDTPMPTVGPGQVLIRTVVAGLNPKDWKVPKLWSRQAGNHGDDMAGYIEAVGEGVLEFRPGDRVAAFHQMFTPHGAYAEFSVAWAKSTFRLPDNVSFEEGATIPLAAMTAALGLYQKLQLPLPWSPTSAPTPLVVNGGATAVGAFVIKLAALSGIHPIIAIAGNGGSFVETLLDRSKGDAMVDYRKGSDYVVEQVRLAAGGHAILHAYDAVSELQSVKMLSRTLEPGKGRIVTVLPQAEDHLAVDAEVSQVMVGSIHEPNAGGAKIGDREFGAVFFGFFALGLADGWITGHPQQVIDGGLGGLESALKNLEAGKLSAKKYVLRLADTPGLEAK
ncbi:GroES-like protein [Thozetella sp. PMI_491]|nr:GroES-like protein [Thozetella sp. PMI_491]